MLIRKIQSRVVTGVLITSLVITSSFPSYSAFSSSDALVVVTLASSAREIRRITPPKLEIANIGKKILCHRPMRHGTPQMSIQKIGGKVIAHNYGHGGSGWTLAPGCASYVNDLLIKEAEGSGTGYNALSRNLKKNSKITVIGAGVLGLFTAYDLHQKGYRNITVVADSFDNLVSHNAGGLLAPVSMDNDPEMQKVIDKIGIDAYKFYAQIARGRNKDFAKGAMILPAYFENREASGLEPYVGKVMSQAKDVTLDFGNGTKRDMVVYDDGIFIDTSSMMIDLRAFLDKANVKFQKKKITSFTAVDSDYIINCTGLGAHELNHDKEMTSVQGHLIMLKDQNPEDLQHMILVYFREGRTESGMKVKRSFYMFPKYMAGSAPNDIGVIGGTFIEGAEANTPNIKEFDIVVKGAKKFYGIR